MTERYFNSEDFGNPAPWPDNGVYVVAPSRPQAVFHEAGTTATGEPIWWRASFTKEVEEVGLATRSLADVRAVVPTVEEADADRVGLALAFGAHLAVHRSQRPEVPAPYAISLQRPNPPEGYVRLPHLLAVEKPGGVADLTAWELMEDEVAARWLDGPLPDQAVFEEHLPYLHHIRQRVRAGTMPPGETSQELTDALAGRYLSILFAYQHVDLFHRLFVSADALPLAE